MARDLKLDGAAHDLEITSGDLSMVSDGSEVAQSWKTRMLWLIGEWFYNVSLGMPWFTKMFRLSASPVARRQYIIDCTMGTQGVRAISSMEQTTSEHIGTLAMEIETEYNTREVLTV
jgi:hypothetical protein